MESVLKANDDFATTESLKDEAEEDEDVNEVEETAEGLMTDMTLEDDVDKIRDSEPGSWMYHIEVYPWNADDVNEHFIRLMKLASFTKLSMRKKPVSHESEDPERVNDRVMERHRKGSLHLYADTHLTAKSIMRHSTWKNMMSKELTFEVTKRSVDNGSLVTARLDVDTYSLCKIRFREKSKGSFKARSAKISNLPSSVTREFLDVVFARSYVAYDGSETELHHGKEEIFLQQTLSEINNFDGSLNIDCLNRGSCRAFVLAHKAVFILGNKLSILANDSQTMVVPPEPQSVGVKKKEDTKVKAASLGATGFTTQSTAARGGGTKDTAVGRASSLSRINSPVAHTIQNVRNHPMMSMGRARGIGGIRGIVAAQQPAGASFTRAGPGMPVPMTGRQKMNEKMRRNHPNIITGNPNSAIYPGMGASVGFRAGSLNSIGDSFKQEIASLQSELERSTQAIEAKIERLKEESSYYNDYNEEMQMYVEGEWDESGYEEYDVNQEEYFGEADGEYFDKAYDIQFYDSLGYEIPYEQRVQQMAPVSRGLPRNRASRGRGLLQMSGQRTAGFVESPSVRNPAQIRRARGRGSGVVFQSPGTSYW